MTAGTRRRRGLVLLCLAVAAGGLAASQVRSSQRRIEAQVGSPVPVLVARREIGPGTRLGAKAVSRSLGVREVPERFVPADSFSSADEVVGLRTSAPVSSGSYLTTAHLRLGEEGPAGGGEPILRRGVRVVEVAVAGGEGLVAGAGGAGARVDVLVTTEAEAGTGRTYVALEDVELLGARPGGGSLDGGGAEGAGAGGGALASLRVTPRQAVFLTAAQNFAREIRLLERPPGDRRPTGAGAVGAAGL